MKTRVVSGAKVVSSSTDPWRPWHRRKARKTGRLTNREQASENRSLRDRAACPTPEKVAHATKHHAKQALKRSRAMHASTRRERDAEEPGVGLGMPRAYRCRCGRWHIGHLPKSVRSGPDHRDQFDAAA